MERTLFYTDLDDEFHALPVSIITGLYILPPEDERVHGVWRVVAMVNGRRVVIKTLPYTTTMATGAKRCESYVQRITAHKLLHAIETAIGDTSVDPIDATTRNIAPVAMPASVPPGW